MTKDKWLGHGAILATNLIFGLNTPIAKTIVPEWISPYALTFVRMVFATLVFWGIGLLAPKEEVGKRDLWTIFGGALFGLVGAQVSFANALLYTSPVNITIIAAMTPLAVMLIAALILKEPVTFKKAAGVLIGASGALLIISSCINVVLDIFFISGLGMGVGAAGVMAMVLLCGTMTGPPMLSE